MGQRYAFETTSSDRIKRSNVLTLIVTFVLSAAATAAVTTALCYSALRPRGRAVTTTPFFVRKAPSWQYGHNSSLSTVADATTAVLRHQALHNATHRYNISMDGAAPIPLQLWQTSRTRNIRGQAKGATKTWATQNPNMTITLQDDAAAAAFIQDFYGDETYQIFQSFPLGVMRADFWRYAVLYAYGGIYADIDTQCLRPAEQWFPPQKQKPAGAGESEGFDFEGGWQPAGGLDYHKLSWNDCNIVIALENDVHFCQWVIASVAGHPLLNKVLHMILMRAKQGFNTSYEHMVHHHTGPGIWTEAISEALGIGGMLAAPAAKAVWTDPAAYHRARSLGVCIVAASFWGGSKPQNVLNMFGSVVFNDSSYPKWTEERADLMEKALNKQGG